MGRPRTEAPPPPYTHGQPPPETPPPPPTPEYNLQQFQQPAAAYPPYPPPQPVAYPPPGPQQLSPLANAGPQPVTFPHEKYTPPPAFRQNASVVAAAQGIPVQQQPQQYAAGEKPGQIGQPGTVQWTTGLFDCRDDSMNAVMTFFFPCVTFGQIAEIVDDGRSTCSTSGMMYGCVAALIALPCLISCGYRTRLRAKYDLVEAPAPDWATHFLCECCALCQEYRELRNRGLDPAIGWHANIARIQSVQQGVVMAPPVNQIMTG